jgi:hypothetical protein
MKSINLWDITPCSPMSVNRVIYCLRLQGRKNTFSYKPARKQVSPKRQLTLNGLHGVISQKLILFQIQLRPNKIIVKKCDSA